MYVCVCVGVVWGFINNYFSSVCMSVCLGDFLYMCSTVVLNLQVTFFLIVFVCGYVYTYLCMFVYILLRPGFQWDCDSWHVTRIILKNI